MNRYTNPAVIILGTLLLFFLVALPQAQGRPVHQLDGYVENTPKDMVTALPGQVTRIKMTFDKPGRYVWHCHILSHEDHEMMRVLHIGPEADPGRLSFFNSF